MILLDTDHFSVLVDGRHSLHDQLVERLDSAKVEVALPVVSVEEQLRAWLAQIHRTRSVAKQVLPYRRLVRLIHVFSYLEIACWTDDAASLFTQLRRQRIRIGTQDLKIASIALTLDAVLLSANLRDFQQVPRLRVEDWLYS
jgi:tRNA(fMet)-specific endonuclease VapC